MSYLVLARKYRPQKFDDVIDQDHITRTLSNAITANRMAHAILFTGPRGTGKTTVARILAKAMNCAEGSTPTPCDRCQSCIEITTGRGVDVFEIDGASNNSVDQIRDLRNNVTYMPAHSAYKIYIIDEVHMLSTAAFNALLKTLEEPPGHVMFIFATTEPHKIPVTIHSRCQRHDFKRIRLESISQHMRRLCELENFEISDESLTSISKEAGGSMRDALSLLDQVMACSSDKASEQEVIRLLGVIDRETIFNFSAALLNADIATVLKTIDHLHDRGHDLKRFYYEMLEHFRNLVVVKMSRQPVQLVNLPAHEIQRMQKQVISIDETHLNQLFDLLFKEEPAIKLSSQTKIALEMTCFRLLQAKPALSIETLIDQLDKLRNEMDVAGDNLSKIPNRHKTASNHSVRSKLSSSKNNNKNAPVAAAKNQSSSPSTASRDLQSNWTKIKEIISAEYPSLGANLIKCQLKQLDEKSLVIEVSGNEFNLSMIRKNKNLEIIRRVCKDALGQVMEIEVRASLEPHADKVKKKKR
jgi:DNA polymerase-3 subunit gamma/tau